MHRKLLILFLLGPLISVLSIFALPSNSVFAESVPASQVLYSINNPLTYRLTASTSSPSISCSFISLNPLNWLLCPLTFGMTAIVNQLENALNQELSVGAPKGSTDPNQIFCDSSTVKPTAGTISTCTSYELAWASMRDIALGLLLVIGLIIIISQALSMEFLDAYTVRRAMPRLVAAAILITLSWPLMQFFVTLTNALGYGVQELIYAPFASLTTSMATHLGGAGSVAVGLIAGPAIESMGLLAVLSFAVTAAVAVFIAYLIVVIRQILIIILVIIAPVAIVCMVLPNTQKAFKFWFDEFRLALLMFPIISALIAAGRVFSAVSLDSSNPNILDQFIGYAAFFAPYFILPFTFKMAGGALSSMAGKVHQGHQGVFNRLQKGRQNSTARRMAALKQGSLHQDRGVGAVVNNLGRRANVGAKGRFGFGQTGSAALATATMANNRSALQNNALLAELANEDDANAVLAFSGGTERGAKEAARDLFGTADAKAIARGDKAVAAAKAIGFTRQNTSAALQTVAQNKSRSVKAGDIATVQRGIGRLATSNPQEAEKMAHAYQYHSREAGRGDLGGSWNNVSDKSVEKLMNSSGMDSPEARRHLNALDGIGRTEVPAMVRGHPGQMIQYADTIRTMATFGDETQKETAAQHLLEMQKSLPYASDDNKRIINALMTGNEIQGIGTGDAYVDYNNSASIEDQLAANFAVGPSNPRGLSGTKEEISTRLNRASRVYDKEQSMGLNGPMEKAPENSP